MTRVTPTPTTARAVERVPHAPGDGPARLGADGPDGDGVTTVVLVGDFNSYAKEDPLQILYDAGYTDVGAAVRQRRVLLLVLRLSGSLDHIL